MDKEEAIELAREGIKEYNEHDEESPSLVSVVAKLMIKSYNQGLADAESAKQLVEEASFAATKRFGW